MWLLSFQVIRVHKNDQGRNLARLSNHYVTMVIKKKKKKKWVKKSKNLENSNHNKLFGRILSTLSKKNGFTMLMGINMNS